MRKDIDRQLKNNVRIRASKKKFELDLLNIKLEPRQLDTIIITVYKDTCDKYTEGKFKLIHYYICIAFSYLIPWWYSIRCALFCILAYLCIDIVILTYPRIDFLKWQWFVIYWFKKKFNIRLMFCQLINLLLITIPSY